MWRKVILPALSAGRAWSTSTGGSWSSAEKIKLVTMIIEVCRVMYWKSRRWLTKKGRQDRLGQCRQGISGAIEDT
jgi:hypothetical protein